MSAYYFNQHHQPTAAGPSVPHNHHGRNRRAPRLSVSQNSQRQFRGVKSMKELNEAAASAASVSNYRTQFEASRSFDLEDDMEFCPKLLTETDLCSISSNSSDRSSLSSNSPSASPTQHPQQVAAAFSMNSSSPAFIPPSYQSQQSSMKLHQPAATRTRNAIPIVNPANGVAMSSPPSSVSPARMQQMGRRW